ncbi:hypothetical protein NEUTE1DRAFT_41564 [Neurospora tetrasperma FGSC 2508]|uniref:Uncharacterized protein n=1 Tax=Neurospora tetrasperma (strain FGSC 2508 / ATCC MYA-4615 / P0657) TaxID=510951 RepID=F8MJX7_NEUT8|nr:uncharacterized protein NEUTE1DRAFT_41564 [Neurospora tetrasperma FGSC 2508]EGO57314.1 hypothetical protein NEUTE1DRAFT_41564 [Neurospora tetrasperma FGSC 2508]EGZ72434.1 hypothetical protein NEUTE2DRAFT_67010 [Neurospora tetrasperma FGSC 2509]
MLHAGRVAVDATQESGVKVCSLFVFRGHALSAVWGFTSPVLAMVSRSLKNLCPTHLPSAKTPSCPPEVVRRSFIMSPYTTHCTTKSSRYDITLSWVCTFFG